jgi:hypothetical protein
VSRCEIRSDELALLLAGIDLGSVKRRRRYRRPASNDAVGDRQPVSVISVMMSGQYGRRDGMIAAAIDVFDGRFLFEPANFEKAVRAGQFAEIIPV